METTDVIVVGAGVIGLAVARCLALRGRDVVVVEQEASIASVTSARNSGVIHAGFYYKPDSLKARACVEGRKKLYAYAESRGVPHARCGKIVVACEPSQIEQLEKLKHTAEKNNVENLRLISAEDVKSLEPEVQCVAALLSPDTGIIDVHSYALALLGDAESRGAVLALHAPVLRGEITDKGFVIHVGGAAPMALACHTLINAAGLGAQSIAHQLKGLDPATIPPQVLAKGSYFSLIGKQPFKRLIYPVPVLGSLGLHACCDLSGRVRFGPDIEWVDHIDYHVDPNRLPLFEEAVRRYWPGLPANSLIPDYAGVRPKLARASHYDTDFVIQTEKIHRIKGLINIYGIESPGLTSSLALADIVGDLLTSRTEAA